MNLKLVEVFEKNCYTFSLKKNRRFDNHNHDFCKKIGRNLSDLPRITSCMGITMDVLKEEETTLKNSRILIISFCN